LTGQEHMLLFQGGRRLLTKMENTLRNNSAFSSIVMNLCEIFTCPACK
jgi:hypothetical protein